MKENEIFAGSTYGLSKENKGVHFILYNSSIDGIRFARDFSDLMRMVVAEIGSDWEKRITFDPPCMEITDREGLRHSLSRLSENNQKLFSACVNMALKKL